MDWLDKFLLKRIIREACIQGNHMENVTELFSMIKTQWAEEFTEDNVATQNKILQECFDASHIKVIR